MINLNSKVVTSLKKSSMDARPTLAILYMLSQPKYLTLQSTSINDFNTGGTWEELVLIYILYNIYI